MAVAVEPGRVTETYAIAMVQGLVLWVVDGQTPVDELERLRAMVRTHPRAGSPSVTLIVIHGTRSTMNADERRSVPAMIDETKLQPVGGLVTRPRPAPVMSEYV